MPNFHKFSQQSDFLDEKKWKNTQQKFENRFFFCENCGSDIKYFDERKCTKLYSLNQNKQGNKQLPKIEKVNKFFVK